VTGVQTCALPIYTCVIVATTSTDSPGLIFAAPFTAMTIAEYFRDIGQSVVLIFDDISTHAKFYREVALLAKTFPGRDSYPGDIFYTYSRLLERAGNFRHPVKGEVSITCFPIVETTEGDMTNFIPTNLMGITDGHIFFDSELFYKGRRPGINASLSVSRVGKQTQSKLARSITREITSFLTMYEKVQALSHFGSELTENVKQILAKGDLIYKFFDQPSSLVIPQDIQLLLFGLIWGNNDVFATHPIESIRSTFINQYGTQANKQLLQDLLQAETLNELLANMQKNKERIRIVWETTEK